MFCFISTPSQKISLAHSFKQWLHISPFLSSSYVYVQFATPFTVIMSDSGVPSTLIDGPLTRFSMNKNGSRTNPQEQDAVYDIMRSTGNDWATDIPDVCLGRWHGIECMPDKDNVYHVVSLSFGALSDDTAFPTCDQARSYISHSITKLPHLRTLFFYRCFSYNPQPIPRFLGQFGSTLQTLVLRENGHIGSIPTELGNLTRLRVLDLHKNNLDGSVPVSLGRITGLRSLDLSGNKLTGSIPGFSFPFLSVFDMSQNLLMGSIPPSLGSCQSLVKIDLSHNRLSGSILDSFSGLKELILMDLSYNRLSGPFPTSLGSLPSLQALILKGNQMGPTVIPSDRFDGMKDLMILVLSNMNLHGPIPESIGRLGSLRAVYLDGNHFNGSIPSNFRDLKNVSEMRLNDNHLTGPIPFGREMVWKMGRKLRLNNNSGLCYNANDGFEDSLDTSSDRGIGLCDAPKPGLPKTVQHLSSINGGMERTINVSNGVVHFHKTSVSVRLSQLTTFLLFVLLS
ncbi:protein TOO MANY MOUTHS [Hibiscus syriacus]|uniref:protein TOO MANY MOUTHS n=1 Tax=Hibiscus syriacus TaxID=106335 RepID=UPI00192388D7|nr:protein TOO MANY MOUTHS [Hibiscus syriacus]